MSQFEVDFSQSLSQLADFQMRLRGMGAELDAIEGKAKGTRSASAKYLRELDQQYKKLEETLAAAGVDVEKLGFSVERARRDAGRLMDGLLQNNLKANTQIRALTGEFKELGALLNDTASKNTYSNWLMRTAQLSNKLKGENQYLKASMSALSTEEGRLNNELKASLATKARTLNMDTKLRLIAVEQTSAMSALLSEQGRLNAINQVSIRTKREEITETTRLQAQYAALERQLKGLNGGQQEQIARIQATIAARKAQIREEMTEKKVVDELTAALKREENQLIRLRAQSTLMAGAHGKQVTAIKQQIAEQERLNKLNAMSNAQLLGLGQSVTRLNLSQQAGAQTAAAFRAAITGLHASFGMYTSATVVAASATYAFTAGVRDSIITGSQFYDTMQRTRAIMSTGAPGWMGDTQASFNAMEAQVRALGMVTVYTASEVGEGLQQLGMAGFSASEAITALPASLQLANLANVSMARSADIATNVLMTFGMQAKELGGVVDLMATAVNNSNTDIEQLANALTYAGPAAKTAGYSLQETVAAIEALANSGFKASRAGTGLRRLMVSLLNPTEKGQAVLDKFGISVTDAEGNARSLIDVIGQLSKAFNGLSGPEQLGAVQNLVGVYATPQVSALIAQYENLQKFAAQNQDVTGAADRMEAIINDSLAKDWKQMLSSIEEVQLTAFNNLDMRLRELTSRTSVWVLSLLEPIGELSNGESFTKLDEYLVKAESAAKAIGLAVGGMVAYKFASGNFFRGLGDDAAAAGERLRILADRMSQTTTSMNTLTPAAATSTTALRSQHMAAMAASTGLTTLTGAAASAAAGLSRLAAGAALLMRGLGWVGLIYGIGSALYEVFGSTAKDDLEENAANVDKIKDSYTALKEEIEATGLAQQRRAMNLQIDADLDGISKIEARLEKMRDAQAQGVRAGLGTDPILASEIKALEGMLGTYGARVEESKASLAALGTTTLDYDDKLKTHAAQIIEVARLTDELTAARNNLNIAMASGPEGGLMAGTSQAMVNALEKQLQETRNRLQGTGNQVQVAIAMAPPARETFANLEKTAQQDAEAEAYKKTASNAQKLLDKEKEIAEARQHKLDLIAKDEEAIARSDRAGRPGLNEIERAQSNLVKLEGERLEIQQKVDEETRAYELARRQANAKNLSDAENLAQAKARDLEITKLIAEAEKPGEGKAVDLKNVTKLLQEQRNVREQINSLTKADGRSASSAAKKEERDLAAAQRQYEGLAKRFDAVSYAQIELGKSTAAMTMLRKEGLITAEQEAKALAELKKQHHEAALAADKQHAALKALRETYGKSPFEVASADLAKMNMLLDKGKLSLAEYSRLYAQMQDKQREAAVSGLPTANFSVGDASSSPFTDWASTEIERAQGLSQYGNRQQELQRGLELRQEQIRLEAEQQRAALEAQQLAQQEHSAKMLEIKNQEHQQWLAAQQEFGVQYQAVALQQSQYAEAMGKMALISAMGAAENLLGMFASAAEDASAAQKIAFVAQKALAVAQIIMYTELAAAQAMAVSGNPLVLGLPLATFIRATGYANAGLVAGLAIGQLASGGSGGGTQMYDTGGYIPYNRVGIVGEYGPELVSGPTHVTGRGASSSKLGDGGGGGGINVEYSPTFKFEVAAGASVTEADIKAMGDMAKGISEKTVTDMTRPNGFLDQWMRNKQGV